MKTPVAFIIFNRPDVTEKVFAEIRKAKPEKLLVIADGARAHKPGEKEKCQETRKIIDQVDWPCEVLKNYAEENMGCKRRVASGITWVFEQVEEAIILEDDCMPNPSFFPYCEELLAKYRNNPEVMIISGDCFLPKKNPEHSYTFSKLPYIWGWASWRRAWKNYDVEMKAWPKFRDENGLVTKTGWPAWVAKHYAKAFEKTYRGEIDTWDHAWTFTIWRMGGVCVYAEKNLITNIGFGGDATHTKVKNRFANLPLEQMQFPLKHPPTTKPNHTHDNALQKAHQAVLPKIWNRLKSFFS